MTRPSRRTRGRVFFSLALVLGSLTACTEDGNRQEPQKAVQQIRFETSGVAPTWADEAKLARTAAVSADMRALDSILASGQPFDLTVLGRTLRIAPSSRPNKQAGVWRGVIQDAKGITGGPALIIRNGNNVFIRLYTGQFGYQIATQNDGTIIAEETNVGALPDESEPEDAREDALEGLPEAHANLQQQTIDVLLLYDAPLKAKLEKMPNGIQNFVTDRQELLDALYLNGRNNLQANVRIVGHTLYDGSTSTNIEQQSAYLKNWPKFETLRTQYKADLVALMSNNIVGSCGIAPVYYKGQDANARSVTDYRCEYKYTLGHEIGHNLGAGHSRGSTTKDRCNFGYRVPNVARTVMAYKCDNNSCPRQPYFSDITIKEGQTTMGRPCGTSTGAQNVLTVRKTIPVVAGFRPKTIP